MDGSCKIPQKLDVGCQCGGKTRHTKAMQVTPSLHDLLSLLHLAVSPYSHGIA